MKKYLLFVASFILISACCGPREFRFALISDLHIVSGDSLAANDLRTAVDDINATPGLDFVLVTGDITENGDRASLERAKEILDGLDIKYYALSGNHETKWSESGATDFAEIFGSERFDFEHKDYRFMGFGTGPVIRMMDGHVSPQDVGWLREELAAEPEKHVFVITHYPLQEDVDNWYEVTDVIRDYNVKAILGGHYHSDQLMMFDGIPGFSCRSTLRAKERTGGYNIFSVTSDSITAQTKMTGGEPQDRGGYSLAETYYMSDNSGYPRPDYSVNGTYPDVKPVWSVNTGFCLLASPLLYGGNIYIGDDAGNFRCLSALDGKELWSFAADNRIVGTADASNGVVVFGSADKNIYALDSETGELLWKYAAKAPVLGAAKIDNGVVYIGASDHTFRALDLATGKLSWEYTGVGGYIETRPLVYDDKVYFGAWDCNIYAVDTKNGSLAWKWDGGHTRMHYSPAAVWPVAVDGKLFFTAPDRVMTALDARTGETLWRYAGSTVRETIGISADEKRLYSKTMQDSVICYSATDGKPRRIWGTDVGYGYEFAASMPVEKEGVVFGSTKNGLIFAIDAMSGEVLWKHKAGNSCIGTVAPLSADECIFASADGNIGLLRNGS